MLRTFFLHCRLAVLPGLEQRQSFRASTIILLMVAVLGAAFALAAVLGQALGG